LEVTISNDKQIEQIKQFLYSEICERRDYSASRMCEEVLKFIEQIENGCNNEQK
jgi:aspartate/glutamate racemase